MFAHCLLFVVALCISLTSTFLNPRTFNPADYTESSATDGFGTKPEIWESGQNDADDGTGKMLCKVEELEQKPAANGC